MPESETQVSMKQTWSDVGESFTSLGRVMRERSRSERAAESSGAGGAGSSTTESGDAGAGDAVRRAFEQVTAAVRELGDRVADVARDDDVKTQARQMGSSFDEALSTTVDQIVAQVSGLFGRSDRRPSDETSSESSGDTSSESTGSAGDDVPPAAPV
jgi:hypothetical protein